MLLCVSVFCEIKYCIHNYSRRCINFKYHDRGVVCQEDEMDMKVLFFNFTEDITLCLGTYKQIIIFPVNTKTLFLFRKKSIYTLQYLQRDLHRVAITCDSVISSQTITNFKHIKILFQLFTHDSDIITGQGITKLMILYSL